MFANTKFSLRVLLLIGLALAFSNVAFAQKKCEEPNRNADIASRVEQGRVFISCLKARKSQGVQRKALIRNQSPLEDSIEEVDVSEVDLGQKENEQAALERKKNFTDFDWGIGVGVAFGDDQRVETAVIENGVVRVTEDDTDEARILLEIHKFFTPFENKDIGVGPFAMVTAGGTGGDVLSSFGLGIMIGFRRDSDDSIKSTSTSSASWNLGIGLVLDNDVMVLGDGIRANEALPEGVTDIRFKKESQDALAIIFSTTF